MEDDYTRLHAFNVEVLYWHIFLPAFDKSVEWCGGVDDSHVSNVGPTSRLFFFCFIPLLLPSTCVLASTLGPLHTFYCSSLFCSRIYLTTYTRVLIFQYMNFDTKGKWIKYNKIFQVNYFHITMIAQKGGYML